MGAAAVAFAPPAIRLHRLARNTRALWQVCGHFPRRHRAPRRRTPLPAGARSLMATASTGRSVTLLDQKQAQEVDARLMSEAYGYTLEQLMEMAGVAVAVAATRECPERRTR
eukprot:ctg_6546.g529